MGPVDWLSQKASRPRGLTGPFLRDTLRGLTIPPTLCSRGRFSVVKKCDQKGTKRAVATKFVNKKLMKRDQVTHELGVLQNVQHPLLVGLLDTFETPTSYVLVLEMCVHPDFPPLLVAISLNIERFTVVSCRNWDCRVHRTAQKYVCHQSAVYNSPVQPLGTRCATREQPAWHHHPGSCSVSASPETLPWSPQVLRILPLKRQAWWDLLQLMLQALCSAPGPACPSALLPTPLKGDSKSGREDAPHKKVPLWGRVASSQSSPTGPRGPPWVPWAISVNGSVI